MSVIPLCMRPHGLGISRRDTMIGVAGMVAENLWKAGNDPDRMDDIYDLLDDPNCMSESDWRNGGLDCGAGLTETRTARESNS